MHLRMDHRKANPQALNTMMQMERFVKESGLDPNLYELVKIRVSQINGCSFCIDMHVQDLLKKGESKQRIYLLTAWREAPCFTERERAALELAEALTLVSESGVSDDVYQHVRSSFDEQEYIHLIMAINTINGWNRLAIATGMFPGCFDE
ncbi:carboxymuconolactone decarboxylase family protein [Salinithrix halophila]|uniref:Carboxymuconolactone decarboxylase family protein n=1 Tax=Salinithrix halophila TaxID=1485204 RepID=A0ABV8JFN9_9BACL